MLTKRQQKLLYNSLSNLFSKLLSKLFSNKSILNLKHITCLILCVLCIPIYAAQATSTHPANCRPLKVEDTTYISVLAALKHMPSLNTFYNTIKKAGLSHLFKYNPELTLLAPDNQAFKKIPASIWKKLNDTSKQDNKDQLKNLIYYHIINSNIIDPMTRQGGKVHLAGAVTINNACALHILHVDNSSIIILDHVLVAPSDWMTQQLNSKKTKRINKKNSKKKNNKIEKHQKTRN